jgi:hypothetical protein
MRASHTSSADFLRHPAHVHLCALLRAQVTFAAREVFQGALPSESSGEVVEFATQLRAAFPDEPLAHLIYTLALELNGKAMSAATDLGACCVRFPEFVTANLIRRRDWLWVANPLKLPPFNAHDPLIHPAINAMLISSIVFLTRDGCMPRAVAFLKDARGDFDPALLGDARMQFTTLISQVTDPQVIAMMGRIYDNPTSPFDLEDLEAPFRPHPHDRRVTLEFFVRQETFPFVIVNAEGRVLHTREIAVSPRMAIAHAELERRFETDLGRDVSLDELGRAFRTHQAQVNPGRVQY